MKLTEAYFLIEKQKWRIIQEYLMIYKELAVVPGVGKTHIANPILP